MSVKSATAKNPLMAGQQQQQPRLAGGLYSQQPRLSKAKSSPNVSRVVAAPVARCSGGGGNVKFEDKPPTTTTTTNRPLKNVNQSKYSVRSGTPAGAQHTQQQQAKDKGRIVSTALTSASKSKQSHGNARMATSNSNKPDLVGVVKKKSVKDSTSSSSCTILEDRVLLKKGLNSHGPLAAGQTNRLPKKPEELKKKVLGRSTSLWNVHSTPMCGNNNSKTSRYSTGDASCKQLANNKQQQQQYPKQQKQQQRPNSGGLSRATSLWSVPAAAIAQCGLGKMPSRIPLSRQHLANLGQSLVDLSRADRSVERTSSSSSKTVAVVNVVPAEVVAVDEVDRSVDEHIYENCRKKVEEEEDQSPIYENLEEIKKKQRELPELTIFDIERRAEQLMAELEADDDDDIPLQKAPTIQQPTILPKKNTSFAKSQDCLNALRHKPSDCEISIRQIRQNWEKQIKGCTDDGGNNKVVEAPISKKRTLSKSINNVNDAALVESKSNSVINNKCQSKRAKDIEHLVNFFNCKNAESTPNKPTTTTVVATASPVIASSWTKSPVVGVKSRGDKSEKSCGYTSDGNSSEDSGHISNENEPDWKDETLPIEEETIIGSTSSSNGSSNGKIDRDLFLAEIIQDLDVNLVDLDDDDEDDENLDVNDKVKTLVKRESVDSCIESGWDDTIKVQTPARKVPPPPTPTKRHSSTPNKIFFRAGTLERLESQRDEKLTGHIILLQARCRGYLARRKLNTLKLQDLAVRCIQRNVRKLMSVREWSWWRLYVKVAPLLNVHRTEDQLKARTEELEVLRAKVDRLEQERNHLKHDNDRLEAKLSEMTADFAEEHSTSTLAAERIDAEHGERLRLERELQDVNETNKNLQQQAERLEMELLYARAADLNGLTSDAEDGEDGAVYKQRYQHAMRELEFTKRKMAQQHEDDLEQLVGLKKQLEKKLADAYEEVEEQRQVVGQWKRRVQKLNGEMHDLRLLLEEQNARNNLLEKKQRKFDAESANVMDELRQEKAARERMAREKEIAIAEKFTIEQSLSDARLELELKEERLHTLTQELEELTFGGKTEEEVAQLKKAKHELEKKLKDQEEELDDLAGQVQLLEQAKLRLEMSIEQQRKEMRKEMQLRDEELEDVRGNSMKKVKALEQQLENEHEERTLVLREKHELERRLMALEDQDRTDRAAEAENTQRLKRDLKRTRALLRDAQTMLERSKGDSTGKAALRHLKNQLEDAECARAVAVKAKQALEQDLRETQAALEEVSRQRSEAEDRANAANRERAELLSQVEENEEELAEVLKKYRATVQQVADEQAQLSECQVQISALEAEKASLKDQLTELSQRLESVEQLGDPTANSLATRRLEFRTKELESKLELEQTTRARLETQIARLKETVEKLQSETAQLRTKEQSAQDTARRLQRSLREAREEAASASAREQEATRARRDLEKALEASEAETKVVKDDLRLALQRIDDLQSAIQGDLDLDCSEEATSENSDRYGIQF
ncbi:hypothetical protein TKK_0006498 [Trichogramma kaykai]